MVKDKRVLVVDDEEDILTTITLSLKMEGYTIDTAVDGEEALTKARSINPDLIILDVMLPSLDGYQICQTLKCDENYCNIPIIIVTARAQKVDEARIKEVKADEYIIKPFDMDLLISTVKKFLG